MTNKAAEEMIDTPEANRLMRAARAFGASYKVHPSGEVSVGDNEHRELKAAAYAFAGIDTTALPVRAPSATIIGFTPPNVAGCAPAFMGTAQAVTLGGPEAPFTSAARNELSAM